MTSHDSSNTNTHHTVNSHLHRLGWSVFFQNQLQCTEADTAPARVVGVRKNCFLVSQGEGERLVSPAGTLTNDPAGRYPAIGDWVLLRDSLIFSVLPRQNVLVRKASGGKNRKSDRSSLPDQIIAANVDTVLIVCGLDRDFNLRRLERYLAMVYNCDIAPQIVLTKADLHDNPHSYVEEVESIAFGVPVHLVSAQDQTVIAHLRNELSQTKTAALIGSSGAGKSTLINRLFGEDIRETDTVSRRLGKGKHTTTNRDLIVLPSGGMVIDNPGMREVAPGGNTLEFASAFPGIDGFARLCRFNDCSHTSEPGCRVLEAVSSGLISAGRLQGYRKIENELKYACEREYKSAARIEKEQWKGIARRIKAMKKTKRR